jgi:hypothetical protein
MANGSSAHPGQWAVRQVNEGPRRPIVIWVIAGGMVFLILNHFMGAIT